MLRPFNEEDHGRFSFTRCNSKNPLVAYTREFTLVVDDVHIDVLHESCAAGECYSMTWEFPDAGTAMLFALSLRGGEPDEILCLKAQELAGLMIGKFFGEP